MKRRLSMEWYFVGWNGDDDDVGVVDGVVNGGGGGACALLGGVGE